MDMEHDANRPATIADIRQLLNQFGAKIDDRFEKLDAKFDRIAIDFARLRGEFHDTKQSIFDFITKKSD